MSSRAFWEATLRGCNCPRCWPLAACYIGSFLWVDPLAQVGISSLRAHPLLVVPAPALHSLSCVSPIEAILQVSPLAWSWPLLCGPQAAGHLSTTGRIRVKTLGPVHGSVSPSALGSIREGGVSDLSLFCLPHEAVHRRVNLDWNGWNWWLFNWKACAVFFLFLQNNLSDTEVTSCLARYFVGPCEPVPPAVDLTKLVESAGYHLRLSRRKSPIVTCLHDHTKPPRSRVNCYFLNVQCT